MNIYLIKRDSFGNSNRMLVKNLETNYPAGEIGLLLEPIEMGDDGYRTLEVEAWLYTANDILILMTLLNSEYGPYIERLDIKYLGFSRQDKEKIVRKGEHNYVYQEMIMSKVVLDMILGNVNENTQVFILDPHSLEIDIESYAMEHYGKFCTTVAPDNLFPEEDFDAIIFPDKGAYDRYRLLNFGKTRDAIIFNKVRGDNGNIKKYGPIYPDMINPNGRYLVIDDICDGGATFIHLHDSLKELGWNGKLYLQVTHGLYTKGQDELRKRYRDIREMTLMPK